MNTNNVILETIKSIFDATEQSLNEYNGQGNLQFSVLIGMVAMKLNWDEKQLKANDPIVRFYVRNNSDWTISRGAHGGIMRAVEKQKKMQAIAAKNAAKKEMKENIEASSSTPVISDNLSSDISDVEFNSFDSLDN